MCSLSLSSSQRSKTIGIQSIKKVEKNRAKNAENTYKRKNNNSCKLHMYFYI